MLVSLRSTLSIATAALALGFSVPSTAGGDKGSAPSKTEAAAKSATAGIIQSVALAHSMVRYGDKNADPVALIAAARMLKQAGARSADLKQGKGDAVASKTDADELSVGAVLDRARKLAGGRADLSGLIEDVAQSSSRGAVDGPGFWAQLALARTEYTYHLDFRGGEFAAVGVTPKDEGDIVLMVFDESGRVVCKKGDDTGLMLCAWYTRKTQTYTIKVINRGGISGYVGYYL